MLTPLPARGKPSPQRGAGAIGLPAAYHFSAAAARS
jgi:hypothetical protein